MSQAEFVETYHKGGLDDFYITRGPEGHVSGNFGEFTSSLGAACSFLEWFLMLTVRRTLSHYFREFVGYMGFGLHRSTIWPLPTPKITSWTICIGRAGRRRWI